MNWREEEMTREKTTNQPQQLDKFEIKVQNKFNDDDRNILVTHLLETGKTDTYILDSCKKSKQKQRGVKLPEEICSEVKLSLTSEESLFLQLYQEDIFSELKQDVYIELPFIADFKLYWEMGEGEEKRQVDRPITYITRDTTPDPKIPTEDAKTVIRIPGDQRAWKLEIKSPRNLKEHYRPKKLLGSLLPTNGTSDSTSVGDNGPGIK